MYQLLVLIYYLLQVFDLELDVECVTLLILDRAKDSFELAVLDTDDDITVHLDQPSVAVVGESLVVGKTGQSGNGVIVETQIQHRVHHARHRYSGTRADGEKEWFCRITEFSVECSFDTFQVVDDLLLESFRKLLTARKITQTDLC